MPIYMLSLEGEPEHIKIGYSADVAQRVTFLQTAHWRRIQIIRILPGSRATESWLHARYDHLHVAYEWFKSDPEMLTIEPGLTASARRKPNRSYDVIATPKLPVGFHADVIRRLGGTTRIAAAIGSTKGSLSKWAVRGIPSRHWLKVIDLGAGMEPPVTFSANDLERTKPVAHRDTA